MRIATWNLDARWNNDRQDFMLGLDADVLLLTEVLPTAEVPGYDLHMTKATMVRGQRYAAIASRHGLVPLPDPRGASAAAIIGGLRFVSSVLPWRSAGDDAPWKGRSQSETTPAAVRDILAAAPDVWGGDWNHELAGGIWSGSRAGRVAILDAIERLQLQVPTSELACHSDGDRSIDHITVPEAWMVLSADRVVAAVGGRRLSDHDAYVVVAEASVVVERDAELGVQGVDEVAPVPGDPRSVETGHPAV